MPITIYILWWVRINRLIFQNSGSGIFVFLFTPCRTEYVFAAFFAEPPEKLAGALIFTCKLKCLTLGEDRYSLS